MRASPGPDQRVLGEASPEAEVAARTEAHRTDLGVDIKIIQTMVISRLSVLVSGFGLGFGLVHTTLVVISECFRTFQGRRLMIMIQTPAYFV